ncbi:S-adenosyl-L-methionine-dependent methyltransferase [Usnea florida]
MSHIHQRSGHPSCTSFDPREARAHINSTFSGEMAKNYHQRTGGCNVILANELIPLTIPSLPPPTTTPNFRILDNACGPMVLTAQSLLTSAITSHRSVHISAVDLSADFIKHNRDLLSSPDTAHWNTDGRKVDTAEMDGMDLQFPDSTFDLSFTSLAIFAFADPVKGARELYRTLKPGGVTAATTWKRVDWLPILHEVESVMRPGQPKTTVPFLEPWRVPGKLAQTLRDGGFQRVEEREIEAESWWDDIETAAYWLTATLKMMVARHWGEEEKERMEEGLREGLERAIRDGSGLVMTDGARVGFKNVAFAGLGWK